LVAVIVALAEVIKLLISKGRGGNGRASNPGHVEGTATALKELNACLVSVKLGLEGVKNAVINNTAAIKELDGDLGEIRGFVDEIRIERRIAEGSRPGIVR
jgi:hypothetical protein